MLTPRTLRSCGGGSPRVTQEALQNTARPRFAVRTTAVCRGRFDGNSGTTPGIACRFRLESWLFAGVGGGRWWWASVAGVGVGRWWRAPRRSRRRSRRKTPVSLIKATKTRHRSKQRKQRTAHPELARVINHQKCAYTPHQDYKSRASQGDDDEDSGT